MPTLTATHINIYHICHRELWLHAHEIRMEHTSDTVSEGRLIGESTYPNRAAKGIQLELSVPLDGDWQAGAKIDYYDSKTKTVHETKKSDRMEQAHLAQVKFYLYLLAKSGVEGAQGIIEYPKQRDRTQVALSATDRLDVEQWIKAIQTILGQKKCPPVIQKPVCKQCSYFEFCYADESE